MMKKQQKNQIKRKENKNKKKKNIKNEYINTTYNNNNHLNIFSSYSFLGLFFFLGIFLIESYPYAPDLVSNIIKCIT